MVTKIFTANFFTHLANRKFAVDLTNTHDDKIQSKLIVFIVKTIGYKNCVTKTLYETFFA